LEGRDGPCAETDGCLLNRLIDLFQIGNARENAQGEIGDGDIDDDDPKRPVNEEVRLVEGQNVA
jgi:hypothetical protein